jgi:hypothetical protein
VLPFRHYKKIASSPVGGQPDTPIYMGQDFWYRLTGDENFYADMIETFVDLFDKEDYSKLLKADIKKLAVEIEAAYFTKGRLDASKF